MQKCCKQVVKPPTHPYVDNMEPKCSRVRLTNQWLHIDKHVPSFEHMLVAYRRKEKSFLHTINKNPISCLIFTEGPNNNNNNNVPHYVNLVYQLLFKIKLQ